MTKLLIVSGSSKIRDKPESPVPALQRFDGVFIKQIRKYYESLQDVDVIILSPVYGLVGAAEEIPSKEPIGGNWRHFVLSQEDLNRLRGPSLQKLRTLFDKKHYNEIYINLGKDLLSIIQGFETTLPSGTTITYAEGRGIGPKMAHMRDWIMMNIRQES